MTRALRRQRGMPAARLLPSHLSEHETCRSDLDQGLARLYRALVVPSQAPVATQPSEAPFDNSASRLDVEAACTRLPFNDLQRPAALPLPSLGQLLAAISRIPQTFSSRGRRQARPPRCRRTPWKSDGSAELRSVQWAGRAYRPRGGASFP
jgi:hypothetical protein